ncbi:hypothetical protein Sjap_011178 [Stephania japonica]|uniref:Uncharacterized protein n=1 Tax=Stephania japonica TaxID=461633 RepID=A0AAP0P7V2_9MAGN
MIKLGTCATKASRDPITSESGIAWSIQSPDLGVKEAGQEYIECSISAEAEAMACYNLKLKK